MCLYVADTVRCENPNTFMSNMLYSLSILYKSKLPLGIVFNKIDILDHKQTTNDLPYQWRGYKSLKLLANIVFLFKVNKCGDG